MDFEDLFDFNEEDFILSCAQTGTLLINYELNFNV